MSVQHGSTATAPGARGVDVANLYRVHGRSLYGFIYSKVGNRAAAEAITADVFGAALTHLDPTCAEHGSAAWLYRVAHDAVHDYWRRNTGAWPPPTSRPLPEAVPWDHTSAAARATAILTRLPDAYRMVLSLRLLDGLSVAETARRMGVSLDDVKVLQQRALRAAAQHDRIGP